MEPRTLCLLGKHYHLCLISGPCNIDFGAIIR
jgi:hypothetical protein